MDASHTSPRHDGRTLALALGAGLVAAAGTWWLTSAPGALGLQPDSFGYVSTGVSLARGQGLRAPLQPWTSPDLTRLWLWEPPGFPFAIASAMRLGFGALDATRVVQALAAAITAVLAALTAATLGASAHWTAERSVDHADATAPHRSSTAAALLATLLLLCSPFFWELHIQALSEPLFLALFAMWAYRSVVTRGGDWGLAAVVAALPVVRWLGLGLLPATAWNARRFRIIAPALGLVALWMLVAPSAMGDRTRHVQWIGENLRAMPRDLAITLIHVAVPVRIPGRSFFGVVAWLLVALLWWQVWRVDREGTRWRAAALAVGAAGLAAVLIPTSLFVDASVRFDEQRHVVPGLLLAMVGIAGSIALAWQRTGVWMRGVFVACAVVWSGAGTYASAELARNVRRAPLFLAAPAWRQAQVLQWLRQQNDARPLYTNQPWALWFHADRVSRIVCADAVDRTLHTGCPEGGVDPIALRDTLARHTGYLVDVTVPWPGILSIEPLARRAGLEVVARFPDGSVWRAP